MAKDNKGMEKHISQLATWIERERQEEIAQFTAATTGIPSSVLARQGLALLALRITKSKTGLGGKTIVDIESGDTGSKLPPHQFKTGDVVELSPQGGGKGPGKKAEGENDGKTSGVVLRVTEVKLVVALDDATLALEALSCFWKITQLANEVTFKRMLNVLKDMQRVLTLGRNEKTDNLVWSGSKELVPLLLATPVKGKSRLEFDSNITLESIQFQDTGLNPSQKEAVRHSLSARHVALIHGPPGTGKTHTLVELIRQFVIQGLHVLVCGPSNAAVDNLLERLVPHRLNCLRVGHPGRVQQPQLMDNVLDIKLRYSDAGQLVKEIRQEMDELLASIAKCKSRSERKQMYTTLSDLRKDFRSRELRATQELVQGAQVVLSTLSGVGGRVLQQHSFDVVVIDEATQAVEAECWIAISRSARVILAGDHHQLPPTIKSGLPGLEKTLFLRLLEHGSHVVRMLTVQYRMHNLIMGFSSSQLYHKKLTAHPSVEEHLLKDLKRIEDEDVTSLPLIFVDTAGSNLYESTDEATEKGSRWNSGEAQLVTAHLAKLIGAGLDPKDIAVISPYNGQVALLKTELRHLYPQLEIGSVDGFQGREKEAVVVSLVRSNSDGEVGFLKDYRRLNVAITRARRHLCLIGDSDTVMADRSVPSKHPPPHANFLPELGKYLDEKAEIWVPEMYE